MNERQPVCELRRESSKAAVTPPTWTVHVGALGRRGQDVVAEVVDEIDGGLVLRRGRREHLDDGGVAGVVRDGGGDRCATPGVVRERVATVCSVGRSCAPSAARRRRAAGRSQPGPKPSARGRRPGGSCQLVGGLPASDEPRRSDKHGQREQPQDRRGRATRNGHGWRWTEVAPAVARTARARGLRLACRCRGARTGRCSGRRSRAGRAAA